MVKYEVMKSLLGGDSFESGLHTAAFDWERGEIVMTDKLSGRQLIIKNQPGPKPEELKNKVSLGLNKQFDIALFMIERNIESGMEPRKAVFDFLYFDLVYKASEHEEKNNEQQSGS